MPENQSIENTYTLPELEAQLLLALAESPDKYHEIIDQIPAGAFTEYKNEWLQLLSKLSNNEANLQINVEGSPAEDVNYAVKVILDAYKERINANNLQRSEYTLEEDDYKEEMVSNSLEKISESKSIASKPETDSITPTRTLMERVLAEVDEKNQLYKETGKTIMGIKTNISYLDNKLNGFKQGLYLLGGPPGLGKTTFCTQISCEIAKEYPVLYITYENSPESLALTSICRLSNVSYSDADRGIIDSNKLSTGVNLFSRVASKIAFIQGTLDTDAKYIEREAIKMMGQTDSKKCFIVIDYLQKMAHQGGYDKIRGNVSLTSFTLREISNSLKSPVLAIVSLNRAGYKKSEVYSIKESGDLEYDADGIIFLIENEDSQEPFPAKRLTLKIAKNRFGEIGKVPLTFRPDIGDFRPLNSSPRDSIKLIKES